MRKIFDYLKNHYYKVMIETKFGQIDFFEMKKIAEEYNKVTTLVSNDSIDSDNESEDKKSIADDSLQIFSAKNGGIDIYYENIHISIIDNDKQHIVRISLKPSYDECWDFQKTNKVVNTSTPLNDTMDVYVYYNVNVMDDRFCENTNYMEGTWNEYVFNAISNIAEEIYGFTQYSKFSKDYAKK